MKKLTILGATGSIGVSSLDVVARHANEFDVQYLSTYQNVALLFEQAQKFRPRAVAIYKEDSVHEYAQRFKEIGVEIVTGFDGVLELSRRDDVDIFVNALVGAVGLQPTLNAIKPGRRIALANKETLVLGGELVMRQARQVGAEVIPIDSEHSALLQCIVGEEAAAVQKIVLTASGGPFRERPETEFGRISVAEALNHPNWTMGPKITIDSATLMNKGLEVIEAFWLFGLAPEEIDVVVHPQSIVHSFVEFRDGSIKAQLGLPDMRVPIQYALSFPKRLAADFPRLDFSQLRDLTFEQPDYEKFRCLKLAFDALAEGGSAPAVLNASNEEAVHLFLKEMIRFDQISQIVEEALTQCPRNGRCDAATLLAADQTTREYVQSTFS